MYTNRAAWGEPAASSASSIVQVATGPGAPMKMCRAGAAPEDTPEAIVSTERRRTVSVARRSRTSAAIAALFDN